MYLKKYFFLSDLDNFKNLSLLKFFIYSFVLIPILLVTGPFLSDLVLSLSSLFFIFFSIKKKIFREYFLNKFFIFFILFWIYILIGSIFSEHTLLSLESSLFYFRFACFSILAYFLFFNFEILKKLSFFILIITFVILIFDGFFEFIFQYNIIGFQRADVNRLSSFFRDELILGSYLVRFLPFIVFLYLSNKFDSKYDNYFLFFIFLSGILIFLSGERASFLLFILFYISYMLISKKFGKKLFINIFFITLSLILIVMSNDQIKERMISKTINDSVLNYDSGAIFFSKNHETHILTAFNIFKSNIVFGRGTKTFRVFCKYPEFEIDFYSCTTHPHNSYFQLLAETGIIGFLFIFSLFVYVVINLLLQFKYKIFKDQKYDEEKSVLLISFLITLWPLITNVNFFNNWINIIYFYPVGAYLSKLNSNYKLKKF